MPHPPIPLARAAAAAPRAAPTRASSALSTAAAAPMPGRDAGSVAQQARMSAARGGGVRPGGTRRLPATPTAKMTCIGLAHPAKGGRPVAHSHSTTPNAQASTAAVSGPPSNCSGAMYWGVPAAVATVDSHVRAVVRAMPKSARAARPPDRSKMLAGLRSRWTTAGRPACRAARAVATSRPTRRRTG
jgi:hypothetical protein